MAKIMIIASLTLFFSSISGYAASPVNLRLNPIHGFWNFALAVTNAPHSSEIIRDRFLQSHWNTAENKEVINTMADLMNRYEETSYPLPGFPEKRDEMSWDLLTFFRLQSGKSNTLSEFSDHTQTLMAPADHWTLFNNLKKLYPIYLELIWKPLLPQLENQRLKLSQLMKKSHWDDLLDRTKGYYRAAWPDNVPFDVVIYPIPGVHGHTNATVIGNMASVEVLTEETALEDRLGVVFHEVCHALYASQPFAVQNELDRHFNQANSISSFYTYELLDEAMATAIGNGWASKKMTGSLSPKSWYDKPQIDAFSKAIYPGIAERLERKAALDTGFLDQMIKDFQTAFPEALTDLNLRMSNLVLAVDASLKADPIKQAIHRKFRMPRTTVVESLDADKLTAALKKRSDLATIVLVFSGKNRANAEKLQHVYPEVKHALSLILNEATNGAVVQLAQDRRLLVLLQINSDDQLEPIVATLRKTGNFSGKLNQVFYGARD